MKNSIFLNMFEIKPTTRQIVEKLAIFNPSLMDNDREFCFYFDQIALNNGYQEFELPAYWTIGRTIYYYKQDNHIKADESAPTKSSLVSIAFPEIFHRFEITNYGITASGLFTIEAFGKKTRGQHYILLILIAIIEQKFVQKMRSIF